MPLWITVVQQYPLSSVKNNDRDGNTHKSPDLSSATADFDCSCVWLMLPLRLLHPSRSCSCCCCCSFNYSISYRSTTQFVAGFKAAVCNALPLLCRHVDRQNNEVALMDEDGSSVGLIDVMRGVEIPDGLRVQASKPAALAARYCIQREVLLG